MLPPDQPDLLTLLDALNRHNVDYVLVGGMAARVYGATRRTQDLDILARDMDDNMERLAAALNDLGHDAMWPTRQRCSSCEP